MSTAGEIRDLDSLLKPLGGFGKFQIINIVCLCTTVLLCAFTEFGYVFTAGELKHRCLISECEDVNTGWNNENETWLSHAIPSTSSGELDSCVRYNHSASQPSSTCDDTSFTKKSYQCDSFVYESEEWTIVREDWDIHCDSDIYLLKLVGSLNNAGQVFGAVIAGYLSDRFGRKLVVLTTSLLVMLCGIIKSFSVNFVMMITIETFEALLAVAIFNGVFVLSLEIVQPSKRVMAGLFVATSYCFGEMILGVAQLLTLNWRNTIRILYAPYILIVIFFWTVPESVRWLLNNDQPEDAVEILRKIAKTNKRSLFDKDVKRVVKYEISKSQRPHLNKLLEQEPMEDFQKKLIHNYYLQEVNELEKGNKFIDLWKSKIMRLRVLLNIFLWLCTTFTYFGMSMNSVSVNNDKFLNFILTSFIEIPAYAVVFFTLDRWGRRNCQSGFLLLCGVACIIDAYVPDGESWSWAKLLLYLVGKFGITISFFIVDVYTTELFPTSMRATMMSTGLMFGKIATVLAPEVPLLGDIYEPLPLLLFGGLAISSGLLAITLPETLNTKLPDTIKEAEALGSKTNNTTA